VEKEEGGSKKTGGGQKEWPAAIIVRSPFKREKSPRNAMLSHPHAYRGERMKRGGGRGLATKLTRRSCDRLKKGREISRKTVMEKRVEIYRKKFALFTKQTRSKNRKLHGRKKNYTQTQ